MSQAPFLPVLDPGTFIDSLAAQPPMQSFLAAEAHAVLVRAQSRPIGKPRAETEDHLFPVGPTGEVPVRIVRPPGATTPLPIVMLFHGGGSILGDPATSA